MNSAASLKNQQGAALIFALLIAILMGVFAAFFTFKAQQNIKMAEKISNRLALTYQANGAVNKALYGVLNLGFTGLSWPDGDKTHPLLLWGEDIEVSPSVTVSIQDLSGKLNVIPFKANEWRSILMHYGKTEAEAASVTDKVEDWMDTDSFRRLQGLEARGYRFIGNEKGPRNMFMQFQEELLFIPGIDAELLAKIEGEIAYWGSPSRSPFVGTEAMIRVYTSGEHLSEIMQQRERQEDLRSQYNKLTQVDASLVNDVPSGIFRIKVRTENEQSQYTRTVDVNLLGVDTMPFYINGWQ